MEQYWNYKFKKYIVVVQLVFDVVEYIPVFCRFRFVLMLLMLFFSFQGTEADGRTEGMLVVSKKCFDVWNRPSNHRPQKRKRRDRFQTSSD